MTRYGIAFVALAGAAFLAGCTDTAENSRRLGSVEAKIKAVEDEKGSLAAETEKLRESSAQLNRILGRLETKLADADARFYSLRALVANHG